MKTYDAIIVGAGISGLYAGYILKQKGLSVKILEASSRLGGRIHSLEDFNGQNIELGAEFIHGKNSVLGDLINYLDIPLQRRVGKSFIYYKDELINYVEAENISSLNKALQFFEDYDSYSGEDTGVDNYLKQFDWYKDTQSILASFGVEYGTLNKRLSIKSLSLEEKMWSSGSGDYEINTPLSKVIDFLAQPIKKDLQLNCQVELINWNQQTLAIHANNETFKAQYVLISTPISILKSQAIHFSPFLPNNYLQAIDKIRIDIGAKVFLLFSEVFWPEGMIELVGGKYCPVYTCKKTSSESNIVTAYLFGKEFIEKAENEKQIVDNLLNDLETIFGKNTASKKLVDYKVADWGKMPFINGLYSYASSGSNIHSSTLSNPIENRIFFIGEATSTNGHRATMHGAMETAENAVARILK